MKNRNLVAQTIQRVKSILVEPGSRPIKIKFGFARDIIMQLDPAHSSQRIYGLYEREIARAVRQYALAANTIVDVGANDGYYTVTLSVLNPTANVFACEPERELKQNCLSNLKLNELNFDERITWISKFIGFQPNENAISLDDLLINAQEPIFIKMDIDGGELEALQSGAEILKTKICLLVVETHSKELEEECTSYLSNLDYQYHIIPNAWWRFFVPELRPIEHNRWFSAKKSET